MSRILVIDDSDDLLELFRLILEPEGYEVHLATHTFEEMTEVEQLQPDLIILDFLFGNRQEGWKMLQKLKMYRPTASIPIVLCTAALGEVREQEDYLRKKNVEVVFKPFEVEDLLQAIQRMLLPPKEETLR